MKHWKWVSNVWAGVIYKSHNYPRRGTVHIPPHIQPVVTRGAYVKRTA